MADKAHNLSEFSVLAKACKLSRPVSRAAMAHHLDVEIEVFDVGRAHPFQIAAAAMEAQPISVAADLSRAIRRERGARSEKAVYVLGAETASIAKIGVAGHPEQRLSELQGAHWEKLHIAALFWVYGAECAIEAEALRLATRDGHRLSGEWVGVPPEQAAMYVAEAVSESSIPVCDSGMWVRNRARVRAVAKGADWLLGDRPERHLTYKSQDWSDRLMAKL